jgi:hypothetical protein
MLQKPGKLRAESRVSSPSRGAGQHLVTASDILYSFFMEKFSLILFPEGKRMWVDKKKVKG